MTQPKDFYPDRKAAFTSFRDHVSRGKVTLYEQFGLDAIMGRREGPFFYDAYEPDRRYWNCHVNGGVFNLGHRNPRVVAAVQRALETMDIGNHHLVSGLRARLAERLAETTGGHLSGVVFGVSGGEATDLAIKVCRAATGRQAIISAVGGYHGHTGLAMATGDESYRAPFGPNPPGFSQVPFNDLGVLEAAVADDTAAVILETVPATLGMPIPTADYLPGVARLCRERGAKLIVDEVQTGLGRTGKIWGYQHYGIEPDALITAKGLSGGVYPITATLMTRDLHKLFDDEPFIHISTYGGAEPGCAAALEVLDIIEEPGFLERVTSQGERVEAALSGASFELRRLGLFAGLKFPVERGGQFAAKMMIDNGIFATWANNDNSVLQFLPPLILTDEQIDEVCGIVRKVFP